MRQAALVERFRQEVVQRGLRFTHQRRAIAEALAAQTGHVSLDELLIAARREQDSIGYATVYRTVKLMVDAGLVHERRFGDGGGLYEVAHDEEHHDHLVCVRCGGITEFEEPRIEALQEAVAAANGFRVVSHHHVIYGVCAREECRRGDPLP